MNNNYWQNKNVFVTGSTGFLGAWLVEELINSKARVILLTRDYVPEARIYKENIINKTFVVRGELEDYCVVERTLNEYEIEVVFHLAAQAIVPIANNNPMSTFESNIKGMWTLLEASRRNHQIKKIIVASSDKAYGEHKTLPYTENMPLQGTNPYDVSKSCADLIAQMYFHHYKLPVCITRCGNLFGGGDLNFSRLIPGTIRSAIYDEVPIIRSDGKYIRDYIYAKDAVRAMLLLAEKMDDKNIIGEAFNFSNETKLTVLEVTQEILSLMNKTYLKPDIRNEAKGEIVHQYLSAEKAYKLLAWESQFSVRQGLLETVKWYENYFETR